MSTVKMATPAGKRRVPYGSINIHADPDGTFSIPRYMVPAMAAAGCTVLTEGVGVIDARAEMAQASAADLTYYLDAQEQRSAGLDDDAARAAALATFDALSASS